MVKKRYIVLDKEGGPWSCFNSIEAAQKSIKHWEDLGVTGYPYTIHILGPDISQEVEDPLLYPLKDEIARFRVAYRDDFSGVPEDKSSCAHEVGQTLIQGKEICKKCGDFLDSLE